MTITIPNEVLDLHTLVFVRDAVQASSGCTNRVWSGFKMIYGIPVGIERCAVGHAIRSLPWRDHADELAEAYEKYDLDPHTLAEIAHANDQYGDDYTPAERRVSMLNWLDRCIGYARNVKHEVERLANQQLSVDKAEAEAEAVAA